VILNWQDHVIGMLAKHLSIEINAVSTDGAFMLSNCFMSGVFDGRPADYLFLLIFNWICLVVSFYVWKCCPFSVGGIHSAVWLLAKQFLIFFARTSYV
jgi:hypothetical protein